jgi:hypothetical protein
MYVTKSRRVRNDSVSDKGLLELLRQLLLDAHPLFDSLLEGIDTQSIASLNARSPRPAQNLCNALPSLTNIAAPQGVHARHQPRILDHEGHELGGVTANTEEL